MELEVLSFHDEITAKGEEGMHLKCSNNRISVQSLSVDFEVTLTIKYDEVAFVPRVKAVPGRASGQIKVSEEQAMMLHQEAAKGGSMELVIDPNGINELTQLRRIGELYLSEADLECGAFRFDSINVDILNDRDIFR
jgi:hypothetical protein